MCCAQSSPSRRRKWTGRQWLANQPLPLEERLGIEQRVRELDRLGDDLVAIDRLLAEVVVNHEGVHQLLTITGVNATVAIGCPYQKACTGGFIELVGAVG